MRALVIVPVVNLSQARTLAQELFGQTTEQAASTFVAALSPTGKTPATHCWMSAEFTPENWAALQSQAPAYSWATVVPYDLVNQPNVPQAQLTAMGLKQIVPSPISDFSAFADSL